MRIDILNFQLFQRRASNKVYQTFRVNRFELWLLCCMVSAMGKMGKKSISRDELFDVITGNSIRKRDFLGYWQGLITAKTIRQATLKNGLKTWVITPLAVKCIEMFDAEVIRLSDKETLRQAKKYPNRELKAYPINDLPPTVIEDMPSNYKSLEPI